MPGCCGAGCSESTGACSADPAPQWRVVFLLDHSIKLKSDYRIVIIAYFSSLCWVPPYSNQFLIFGFGFLVYICTWQLSVNSCFDIDCYSILIAKNSMFKLQCHVITRIDDGVKTCYCLGPPPNDRIEKYRAHMMIRDWSSSSRVWKTLGFGSRFGWAHMLQHPKHFWYVHMLMMFSRHIQLYLDMWKLSSVSWKINKEVFSVSTHVITNYVVTLKTTFRHQYMCTDTENYFI